MESGRKNLVVGLKKGSQNVFPHLVSHQAFHFQMLTMLPALLDILDILKDPSHHVSSLKPVIH